MNKIFQLSLDNIDEVAGVLRERLEERVISMTVTDRQGPIVWEGESVKAITIDKEPDLGQGAIGICFQSGKVLQLPIHRRLFATAPMVLVGEEGVTTDYDGYLTGHVHSRLVPV
jgi:hypothetical protein